MITAALAINLFFFGFRLLLQISKPKTELDGKDNAVSVLITLLIGFNIIGILKANSVI